MTDTAEFLGPLLHALAESLDVREIFARISVGARSSNVTWQAFAGPGYHFAWVTRCSATRYVSYRFHGDRPVSELAFGGSIIGIGVNF